MDSNSGYSAETKTFHSLRPPVPLPPETAPFSAASYSLSLRLTSPSTALIDSATGECISYSKFPRLTKNLASSLQNLNGLSKGQTAFILSPNSTRIAILYFSLFSLGVVAAPPVMVASIKDDGFDLKSLEAVGSGGAPLVKDVIGAFNAKFSGTILF